LAIGWGGGEGGSKKKQGGVNYGKTTKPVGISREYCVSGKRGVDQTRNDRTTHLGFQVGGSLRK